MQLGDLGERCKVPQWVRAEPGRQTTFGAYVVVFWSENVLSGKVLNAGRLGSAVSFPAGPGGARPPNDIWCILA